MWRKAAGTRSVLSGVADIYLCNGGGDLISLLNFYELLEHIGGSEGNR